MNGLGHLLVVPLAAFKRQRTVRLGSLRRVRAVFDFFCIKPWPQRQHLMQVHCRGSCGTGMACMHVCS